MPSLSLIVPDTFNKSLNLSTSPYQLQSPIPNKPIVINSIFFSLELDPYSDTSSTRKRKSQLDVTIQTSKKTKLQLPIGRTTYIDQETVPINSQFRVAHYLRSKRSRKRNIATPIKIIPSKTKSDGFSSEAVASFKTTPNSEDGFVKPPVEPLGS